MPMDIRHYLTQKFGKNVFSLSQNDLLRERVKTEKNVERLSDDIKAIQERIQKVMLESKGQTKTLKLLNVQKIKSLRLEASVKQQEAARFLRELQILLLIEAMHEQKKFEKGSDLVERVMNTDVDELSETITDIDVRKAIEDGRMDLVKGRLSNVYGKEEMATDEESLDIMKAINDLEKVDEDTAIRMAGEKARVFAEEPAKKKQLQDEEKD